LFIFFVVVIIAATY